MRLEAYFDDIRRICVYHEYVDLDKLTLLKNRELLDVVREDAGFGRTFVYLKEDIDFSARYSFLYKGERYPVIIRHVHKTSEFDEYFACDLNTLGPKYTKEATTFRIWAPMADEVRVLFDNVSLKMKEGHNGVFELKVRGDMDKTRYRYMIERSGEVVYAIDPFAYSSSPNGQFSVVVDEKRYRSKKIRPQSEIRRYTDAIIYEASVRDLTSMKGLKVKNKKTFKGLLERARYNDRPIGIEYIKDLGVSHIQLMPVFDFARIDEKDPHGYNWGYDPVQYNVVEGTYTSDVYDPYKRIYELQQLIDYIHSCGLYVNLDVVFNHVFEAHAFSLDKILPYYFFRYRNETELANGTACGNELRTESFFLRAYLKLMCERYIDIFDIDGLRFDLMNIIDIDTINKINEAVKAKKEWFMMYGEAWNMGEGLALEKRATADNYRKFPGVAYFDGFFRDEIRGNVFGKEYPGYINGDLGRKEAVFKAMCNKDIDPSAHINFLECHDNRTFYDSMKLFHPNEEDVDDRLRIKLALAMVILAQGIPFIHSGQEFARTKKGNENSYIAGDDINMIDYARRDEYIEITYFLKDMIKIRKWYPCLRLDDIDDVRSMGNVTFYDEIMVYDIANLKILINPTLEDRRYYLKGYYLARYDRDHFVNFIIHDTEVPIERLSLAILEKV